MSGHKGRNQRAQRKARKAAVQKAREMQRALNAMPLLMRLGWAMGVVGRGTRSGRRAVFAALAAGALAVAAWLVFGMVMLVKMMTSTGGGAS